jgi:hypothetical protein
LLYELEVLEVLEVCMFFMATVAKLLPVPPRLHRAPEGSGLPPSSSASALRSRAWPGFGQFWLRRSLAAAGPSWSRTVVMWKCLGGWRFMKVYEDVGFLGYWNWLKLNSKVVDMSWYDHILIIYCWVNCQRSQTWPEMPIVYLRQYVKQIYKIWIRRCLIFVGRIPHDMNRVGLWDTTLGPTQPLFLGQYGECPLLLGEGHECFWPNPQFAWVF